MRYINKVSYLQNNDVVNDVVNKWEIKWNHKLWSEKNSQVIFEWSACFIKLYHFQDHFLGLQYRDAAPSSLHSFFETPLKPSLPAWSILPSSIPKLHAIEPFSWIFNSESIRASQDERRYSATNQCERVLIEVS